MQAIAAARTDLVDLADAILKTPNVTVAILATTGFDLPAPRTPTGTPNAPANVRLKHGDNAGDVIPLCDAVTTPGVRTYEVQWTFDPNAGPWTDGGSFPNSRSMLLTGLQRGKDIWVRIRVQATGGFSAWSDPATIMVT